jgi:N-acetylglucosaminyldiphosphoundecaprenol N-acetyl-beta-D-mannosaminyltransferase
MLETIDILGIRINNISLDEAVNRIDELSKKKVFSYTVTPNVDHLVKLQKDVSFRRIYQEADLVVADGVPLLWAARFLGTPLKGRVNGTDLFEQVAVRAAESGKSIFLLGGEEGSAEKAAYQLQERHPDLLIAGWYCPPFGFERDPEENGKILRLISNVQPTYLFVGLGTPKQESWIAKHGAATGARHAIGIGVSFSFVAGMIRRAPPWMQRYGLEWLWRLGVQPNHLWRRYLVDDPCFFWLVFKQKIGRSKVC